MENQVGGSRRHVPEAERHFCFQPPRAPSGIALKYAQVFRFDVGLQNGGQTVCARNQVDALQHTRCSGEQLG